MPGWFEQYQARLAAERAAQATLIEEMAAERRSAVADPRLSPVLS